MSLMLLIIMMYTWLNVASLFMVSLMVNSGSVKSYRDVISKVGIALPLLYVIPTTLYLLELWYQVKQQLLSHIFKDIYVDIPTVDDINKVTTTTKEDIKNGTIN